MTKQYFANYFLHTSDVTMYVKDNRMNVLQVSLELGECHLGGPR